MLESAHHYGDGGENRRVGRKLRGASGQAGEEMSREDRPGAVLTGTVDGLAECGPRGLGGLQGLVPLSELCPHAGGPPPERLRVGEAVTVKVRAAIRTRARSSPA